MTIAARFLNEPLALPPDDGAVLLHILRNEPRALALGGSAAAARDYRLIEGVAVIQVLGALSHSAGWPWVEETTYSSIARAIALALEDTSARAIVLQVDSPGGDVAGLFDLCDAIFEMRGEKPLWAILDENAYSAAYAIASACDHVTVPRTGGTGSIGIIQLHADLSKMLKNAGIAVTTLISGERKADGSPYEPLGDEAQERMQQSVDTLGKMFVEMVARNRNLPRSAVRGLEGGTLLGKAGVRAGLADEVAAPTEAFLSLLDSLPKSSSAAARSVARASR